MCVDLELKDLPAALSDLGHALETAPDDVATLGVLADAAGPEKALALIESHRPSEAGPRAPWLVLRGAARAQTKDADGALADFKAALALDARAACFGAGLPKRRDRIDPRYFDLCLERFPKDAGLHVDRGVALFEAGQRAGAEADFRRAAALDPGDERARQSLEALLNPRP